MHMKYISSTLAIVTLFSQLAFTSCQDINETDDGARLPKSMASQRAFYKRDADQVEYILKIQAYLSGEAVTFDPDDANYQMICSQLKHSDGRVKLDAWANKTLAALNTNMEGTLTNLERLGKASTFEEVEDIFKYFVTVRKDYFFSRLRSRLMGGCVPSTKPEAFSALNPLSKQSVQLSIDRHALMCEVIKEAYKVLLRDDQERARACLESIEPGTILVKYLMGEVKDILDPDSCTSHDASLSGATAPPVQVIELDGSARVNQSVSAGNATKDRLRRKLAQKQSAQKSVQDLPKGTRHGKPKSKSKPHTPGPKAIALIKEHTEFELANQRQKEEEKRARALAQAEHALRMKALIRQARLEALAVEDEASLSAFSSTSQAASSSSSHSPIPSKQRIKTKTRGIADLSKRRWQDTPRASEAQISSGKREDEREVETQHAASLYKRLVSFWGSKAGQTYHDVAYLFSGLGGRITEKKGGSSHVTLTYHTSEGRALKHELWRPHGSGNTFGFRTPAGLQSFFEKCGLTLRD